MQWTASWDTRLIPNGVYALSVQANGVSTPSIDVTVHNTPTQTVYYDPDNDGYGTAGDDLEMWKDASVPSGYNVWETGKISDNCPDIYNPNQKDSNGDGKGDACDPEPAAFSIVKVEVKKPALAGVAIESARDFLVTFSRPATQVTLSVTKDSTGKTVTNYVYPQSDPSQASFTLSAVNLEPATLYRYVISAKDAGDVANMNIISSFGTFTTDPAVTPPPTTSVAPFVYIPSKEADASPDINTDKSLVPGSGTALCASNSRIKGSTAAVYYCGADGKRYVFVNAMVYSTWYPDFNGIVTVSDETLAKIPLGGNVNNHPGTRPVKITSDPRVYAVSRGGVLHLIPDEATASRLFSINWNKITDDVSDAFWVNYKMGAPIAP